MVGGLVSGFGVICGLVESEVLRVLGEVGRLGREWSFRQICAANVGLSVWIKICSALTGLGGIGASSIGASSIGLSGGNKTKLGN